MSNVVDRRDVPEIDTNKSVDWPRGEARHPEPLPAPDKAEPVLGGDTRKARAQHSGTFLRPRRIRGRMAWDADEVATHLMRRRAQIVRGLARRTPWAGLDDDTLDSFYAHAAAVIVKVAVSDQRPDWRSPKDLERAQVAAFRHQALDHWKRVNAHSRQADRHAVAFDPELHASKHTPIDRLFEQPDVHTIQRDLLAEIVDPAAHHFWSLILGEQMTFKAAGDRLALSKPEVMAFTRSGRALFSDYLDRRASGQLCLERSGDVKAMRAGTASEVRVERAEAHLESCYACALVHEPGTSAIQRGLLGLGPTGLILRLLSRAGDIASTPAMRVADSGTGSRAVAAGLAALTVGAGATVHLNRTPPNRAPPPLMAPHSQPSPAQRIARTVVRRRIENDGLPAIPLPRANASRTSKPRERHGGAHETAAKSLTPLSEPQPPEFDLEAASARQTVSPRIPSPSPASATAQQEFNTP